MNCIKHICLFLLISLLPLNSFGRNPYIGFKAGLNLSHMYLNDDSGVKTNGLGLLPGFHAGPTIDYRVSPEITINGNILLSTKGYVERTENPFKDIEVKTTNSLYLFYVDVPIYVKYEFEINGLDVFAEAGPYMAYGFTGKRRRNITGGGETELFKGDIYWGDDPETDDYKHLDYGAGIGFGAKLLNMTLDVGYNMGIANISTNRDLNQVYRNGAIFVSFSYYFSKFYKYSEGNY